MCALAGCGRIFFDPLDAPSLDGATGDGRNPCLPRIDITTATGSIHMPTIAAKPDLIAVMWMDEQDNGLLGVHLELIDPDGTVRTTPLAIDHERPPENRPWLSGIAASPSVFGVAWFEYTATYVDTLYFATVGFDGVIRSGPTLVVPAVAGNASVLWTGSAFAVVYAINRDNPPLFGSPAYVDVAYFDESGASLGPPARLSELTALANYPAAVWTGSGFIAAWADARAGMPSIYLTTADAAGTKTSADIVRGRTANLPYLAWNGSEALLVYPGPDVASPQMHLERYDAAGNMLGATFLPLAVYNLAAAWDRDHWVVIGQIAGAFPVRMSFAPDLTQLGSPVDIWQFHSGFGSRIAVLSDRLVITEVNNDDYPMKLGILQVCAP